MRAFLPLLWLLACGIVLSPPASAAIDDPFDRESDAKPAKPEKAQPRDVLRFNAHAADSPAALLDAIYAVDWWINSSAKQLDPTSAKSEILEVHLDLFEDWMAGLDIAHLAQEERDTHFDPAVSFTERIFLSWDLLTDDTVAWQQTRDLALDDLRLQRPEAAIARYRQFRTEHTVGAHPDQVLLFLRQIGASRIRAGGPAWRNECLALYRREVATLLGAYPQFAAMRDSTRSQTLEMLFEAPTVKAQVWRIRTLLDMLTASGAEGYTTLLDYRATDGEEAFLPYPEKIALDGGGLGVPWLKEILQESTLSPARRKGLIAVALEHAQHPVISSLNFADDLLDGRVSLYSYTPIQRVWLEGEFRQFLLDPNADPNAIEPIFIGDAPPRLPQSLRSSAGLLLQLEDPLAEIDRLLSQRHPPAEAVGLAAMSLTLEESGDFTSEEWLGTEAGYSAALLPYLTRQDAPELRDLALLILTQLAQSPEPLTGERWMLAAHQVGLLLELPQDALPARADIARILTLGWYRRGIQLDLLRPYVPAVTAYVARLDPEQLGLEACLDLLRFNRALLDPAQNPTTHPLYQPPVLSTKQRTVVLASALDRMIMFFRYYALGEIVEDIEALYAAGLPNDPAINERLADIVARRESNMLPSNLAERIDQILERP